MLGARAVAYNDTEVHFHGPFPKEILLLPNCTIIFYDQTISVTPSKDIFEISCGTGQAQQGWSSSWVPAPIIQWTSHTVRISNILCQDSAVVSVRYAWKDWPCDFKACPIYSSDKMLPAPPFIGRQASNEVEQLMMNETMWKRCFELSEFPYWESKMATASCLI